MREGIGKDFERGGRGRGEGGEQAREGRKGKRKRYRFDGRHGDCIRRTTNKEKGKKQKVKPTLPHKKKKKKKERETRIFDKRQKTSTSKKLQFDQKKNPKKRVFLTTLKFPN